jgi:hypothetical protein
MIGGPNDVVIESEIIRAEARDSRLRDAREMAAAPANGFAWPPAPPSVAPTPEVKLPVPPVVPEPEPQAAAVRAEERSPPPGPPLQPPAPPPRAPAFPLPPRRPPPPLATGGTRPSPLREQGAGRLDIGQRPESGTSPAAAFPRAPIATPFIRPQRPVQGPPAPEKTPASSAQAASTQASQPGAPAPVPAPPPPPVASAAPVAAKPSPATETEAEPAPALEPIDTLGALEEEMAKLLGRSPNNP